MTLPQPLTDEREKRRGTPFDFAAEVFEVNRLCCAMRPVHGDWRERFNAIRHNYRVYEDGVRRGVVTWGYPCDPYMIADWVPLMTPIESAMWGEIRSEGLPFWPQFPVGKYMIDFGDPVRRIAIECDGKEFHQDWRKDAVRDDELAKMGWTVYRIPGAACLANEIVFTTPEGFQFGLDFFRIGRQR